MLENKFFHKSTIVFKILLLFSLHQENNKSWLARFLKCWNILVGGVILVLISLSDTIEEMKSGEIWVIYIKALYLLAMVMVIHKMVTAALAEDKIYACIRQLERFSKSFKDTTDIENCLKLYNKLFLLGMACANTCSIFFMVAPLKTSKYRPLPFTPKVSFVNITKTPIWQLIYLYEFYALFCITTCTIGFDTLFCGMMSTCSGILSCLCQEIREIDDYIGNHQKSETKMKAVIDKINRISELTMTITDIFSVTTMSHIICNCDVLALSLFMVSSLPFNDLTFISMTALVFLTVFQLGIYCYFGQEVVNQREILQNELYFTRWYDASKNYKTMLLMAIFESQNNRYIYAGKVIPLSLATLTEVAKKAYAFFTFLNESRN